jgi:hypothetical protein
MRNESLRGRGGLTRVLAGAMGAIAVAGVTCGPSLAVAGAASSSWRLVSYLGEHFEVPASWPIYRLSASSTTCVRFDRHAVYLGSEGAQARCPAAAIGVASAMQIQPLADLSSLEIADRLSPADIGGDRALVGGETSVTHRLVAVFPDTRTEVTLSYLDDESVPEAILSSFRSAASTSTESGLAAPPRETLSLSAEPAAAPSLAATRAVSGDNAAGSAIKPAVGSRAIGSVVYTGKGFDACNTPTESQMAVWKAHSPYRAFGAYIGGVNAMCPPGNNFATWVSDETTAGWHIFPIYVGLQAPCNGAFATMSSKLSAAASQGVADATDAVSDAESYGIGRGATLYFDMEAWNVDSSSCTNAVLHFIAGWTEQLHRDGYHSGVYSSLLSGIASPGIVSMWGEANAPDVVWFADWDGAATTSTGYIPSSEWANHQRIKQYNSENETFGGVTLSVDPDYLDAPTVGVPTLQVPTTTSISPPSGPAGNVITVTGSSFVKGKTSVDFGDVPGRNVNVISSSVLTVTVPSEPLGRVPVLVTNPAGQSASTGALDFSYVGFVGVAADKKTGGYWFVSSAGNVENFDAPFEGSMGGKTLPAPIVSVAPTATGYVMTTSEGNVYAFGTPWYGSMAGHTLPAPVVSISATPTGYLLTTSKGNVYAFHTGWRGSLAGQALPGPIVGVAGTSSGYVLTSSKGNVYAFGTPWYGSMAGEALPAGIVGIASTPTGYLLTTSEGNVYAWHTPWHGSAAGAATNGPVVGITTTSTGYVLATGCGSAYTYGTNFDGSPAG